MSARANLGWRLWALLCLVLLAMGIHPQSALAQPAPSSQTIACRSGVDISPALARAAASLASGGALVIGAPGAICSVSAPVTFTKAVTITLRGTIQPLGNPAGETAVFSLAADNISLVCDGGGFDGVSAAHNKWQAVAATSPGSNQVPFYNNVWVKGCAARNMGLGDGANQVFTMQSLSHSGVQNISCRNAGGYCLYSAFNSGFSNQGISCDTIGYACVSISAGVNNQIAGGRCHDAFFCFKGGFGFPLGVSNDCAPRPGMFCVGGGYPAIAPGTYVLDISAGSSPLPGGYVSAIQNRGSYLVVYLSHASGSINAGDKVMGLETGTHYSNITMDGTSSNGFDYNGFKDLTIDGVTSTNAGRYNNRIFLGDIWAGFDPYAGNNHVNSDGLVITNFHSSNSAGSALSIQAATSDVDISNFDIQGAGISFNVLTYYRSNNVRIHDGSITSAAGAAIQISYGNNDSLSNIRISGRDGLELTSEGPTTISGVNMTLGGDPGGSFAVKIDSTGNASRNITLRNVQARISGTGAQKDYGLLCADPAASSILLDGSDDLRGQSAGFQPVGGDPACLRAVQRQR